jgi:hypothetical protein
VGGQLVVTQDASPAAAADGEIHERLSVEAFPLSAFKRSVLCTTTTDLLICEEG